MTGLGSCRAGLRAAKIVAREKFAWPGGYALFLVMSDGGILCPECIRANWRSIVQYTLWRQPQSGWDAAGLDHTGNCDDPPNCDDCGRIIE